jgi:hypothetical protein
MGQKPWGPRWSGGEPATLVAPEPFLPLRAGDHTQPLLASRLPWPRPGICRSVHLKVDFKKPCPSPLLILQLTLLFYRIFIRKKLLVIAGRLLISFFRGAIKLAMVQTIILEMLGALSHPFAGVCSGIWVELCAASEECNRWLK